MLHTSTSKTQSNRKTNTPSRVTTTRHQGAITLYAIFGTIISCFCVGLLVFAVAKKGLIQGIDQENPMEALLFGALISAVDPVATLSILGNTELQCDPLLYSLVFGESVLNDATAIVLFNTFHKYYNPDGPDLGEAEIPSALLEFTIVFTLSILVGVALGLVASFIYKHTSLSDFPTLETSLLVCFCYLCYSVTEAMELSGIMALFFNGIVLSHYNSYNLSSTAHVASESLFSTLATVTETLVFLYMGLSVFTGRFRNWDVLFSILCLSFCLLGRALNIFPLSFLANCCRQRGRNKIPMKMQGVLWFAGLRGAIAFALAENMPGPNKETYVTATLSICVFTTIVCGASTEKILSMSGMRRFDGDVIEANVIIDENGEGEEHDEDMEPLTSFPIARRVSGRFYSGMKGVWKEFDNQYLKRYFGGSVPVVRSLNDNDAFHRGSYELTSASARRNVHYDDEDEFFED
jgi:sodium/hydrogen exchanger 8